MLIDKLCVHNFRCYRETHEIDLSTTQTANVVVVYGENMRGKTTLLQAIRWALYGEVRDRDNNIISVLDPQNKEQLLSQEAESDGDFTMRVEIEFDHEDSHYVLRRAAEASGEPSSNEEFTLSVNLKKDSHELPEISVDACIQSVLSNDVSRFFLFDGEMLQEYERLLNNPDQEALAVKESIEKILGLPALYVYKDLGEEASRDEKRLNTQLRKRAKYSDLVGEVMRLENVVTSFKRDLGSLEKSLEGLQQEADEAELAVSRMGDLEKDDRENSTLEQQIQTEQQQKTDNQEAMRDILANTWWLPVSGVIDKRLEGIQQDIGMAVSNLETIRRLEALKVSIAEKTCQLCSLPLDKQKRDALKKEITSLRLENFALLDSSETEGIVLGDLVRRQQIYESTSSNK
jgi:DNA sulfur modification protein DndD